jgi:hypothetical protein
MSRCVDSIWPNVRVSRTCFVRSDQQPSRANERSVVRSCLVDELLSERPIWPSLARLVRRCRHRHIMVNHGCLSFQPSESLSV